MSNTGKKVAKKSKSGKSGTKYPYLEAGNILRANQKSCADTAVEFLEVFNYFSGLGDNISEQRWSNFVRGRDRVPRDILKSLLTYFNVKGSKELTQPIAQKLTQIYNIRLWSKKELQDIFPDKSLSSLINGLTFLDEDSSEASDTDQSPFVGLRPFREDDSEFFYGRNLLITKLIHVFSKFPLIILYGPSGSGKSSVVLAGIIPGLRNKTLIYDEAWGIIKFRPGKDPFESLTISTSKLYQNRLNTQATSGHINRIISPKLETVGGIYECAKNLISDNNFDRILIFIDQFEEILSSKKNIREKFFSEIIRVRDKQNKLHQRNITILITLNSEFLGEFQDIPDLFNPQSTCVFEIKPMNTEQIRDVIEGPAKKLRVEYETGLVNIILEDVENHAGYLPILEFSLNELWNKKEGGLITFNSYLEIGTINGALAKYADKWLAQYENPEKILDLIINLVDPCKERGFIRKIVNKSELSEDEWILVQKLAAAKLVVIDADHHTKQPTVELAHESLIHKWDKLNNFITRKHQL